MEKLHIDDYLNQAKNLRFKLLAIIGKNHQKKEKIIKYLESIEWNLTDVENDLLEIKSRIESIDDVNSGDETHEIGKKIKEWFNEKPDNVILINSSILYHKMFMKISPIGAFKYRTRNKNTVIFLEDEKLIGNRISIGSFGDDEYTDQEIKDIVFADINDIKEDFKPKNKKRNEIDINNLPQGAIGNYFTYKQIKDVIDIDTDLKKDESKKEIVSSYIVSESLENQINEFFYNLEKPTHQAVKIIGNYGSGKSHMIAFLISLIYNPKLSIYVKNEKVKNAINNIKREYKVIQFELMPGDVELAHWFYREVKKQLHDKYNIDIPNFELKDDINHKDNFTEIINNVKKEDPQSGLVVVIDELSDFLDQKQRFSINRDFQFLRVVAQFCQANDMVLVTSMQEDIYSSNKFKDIAESAGRIDARFQNIIIHKEDVNKVISERIIQKTEEQKHKLELKFSEFTKKIEDVSIKIDQYIDLFPLTPFLLDLFNELPYFEKRGVIQFAQNNIKYILDKEFPYFLTFDSIYDILELDPNKKNIEEIYKIIKTLNIVKDKINNVLEERYRKDALKIVKGLAVYSIWSKGKSGVTVKELAEKLMIISDKFDSKTQVSLIVKKIREVTDNNYIKVIKNEADGNDYLKFDVNVGVDPDEKIDSKEATISNDLVEEELFKQIENTLELTKYKNNPFIFDDECEWDSVCSYRKGYIIFYKQGTSIHQLEERDYSVNIISPYYKEKIENISQIQINIRINIGDEENVKYLKRIQAIRSFINNNIMKSLMELKLRTTLEGGKKGQVQYTGIKQKLTKWFFQYSKYNINNEPFELRNTLKREPSNLQELLDNVKKEKFDSFFNDKYINHPNYPMIFSSSNMTDTFNKSAKEIIQGDVNKLQTTTVNILSSLSLIEKIDNQYDLVWRDSEIPRKIVEYIKENGNKITDIQKDIYSKLLKEPYGLEKELIDFLLIYLTFLGIIFLQQKGGSKIDIGNVKDTFHNLSQFENIAYAKLEENQSYDFAKRLLNVLGLNGSQIEKDKTRAIVFKDFRIKIDEIIDKISKIETLINKLEQYPKIIIDITKFKDEFNQVKAIEWDKLKIKNQFSFKSIENYENRLGEIKEAIDKQNLIYDAIMYYKDSVHNNIEYMDKVIDMLNKNSFLSNEEQRKKLKEFYDDTLKITKDYDKFKDQSERNPLEGKFQAFQKLYIYDIYFPKHEDKVGKKVDWNYLFNIDKNELYKKLVVLKSLVISFPNYIQL